MQSNGRANEDAVLCSEKAAKVLGRAAWGGVGGFVRALVGTSAYQLTQ